ncbi:hypothetical protein N665_0401s0036 [Sinapis alba]|nr:hypothetical protein N665_0401s0036 [Sinapis alba]
MEYLQQSLLHDGNCTRTIPLDLLVEILYLLPTKSLIRFQSVSKLWFSTIHSKIFVDLFLTRSKARPRLLISMGDYGSKECFIFSAPEHDNNDDYKSSTVMARYEAPNLDPGYYLNSGSVNGFVCFRGVVPWLRDYNPITVYNPTTRQIVKLPDVTPNGRKMYTRLGYDPVEDQYKVLCVMMLDNKSRNNPQEHLVCTVSSSEKQEWRKIENTTGDSYHSIYGEICIDGAIYYRVGKSRIVKFNVRSEKIEFIKTPKESHISTTHHSILINYNGKLGGVHYLCTGNLMTLWVFEDVEKQEWSRMACIPCTWPGHVKSKGVIHTGELMLFNPWFYSSKPFYICYYDFNKKSIRKAEIRGLMMDGDSRRIHGIGETTGEKLCFPGHIENIRFL